MLVLLTAQEYNILVMSGKIYDFIKLILIQLILICLKEQLLIVIKCKKGNTPIVFGFVSFEFP